MTNILNKPYTNEQYTSFAHYANQTGKRIEITDVAAYALLESEIVQDSEIVNISDTAEYLAKELKKAKEAKIAENEQARNVEYITTSLGKLKTQTPLGDLKLALSLYEKIAKANNGLPEGAVRLYDEEGNVTLSSALSLEQFEDITLEIAAAYMEIDIKSTTITKAIQEAQTLKELNRIEISY